MPHLPYIAETDDVVKFMFGIIAVVIWVLATLASATKKQNEQKRQEREAMDRARQDAAGSSWSMPVPPVQPPAMSGPRVSPRPQRQRQPAVRRPLPPPLVRGGAMPAPHRAVPLPPLPPGGRQKKSSRGRQPRPPAVPLAPPVEPALGRAPLSPDAGTASAAPAGRGEAARPPVGAVAIARWLTPQTLRSQFILTEILQPPVALRDSRDGPHR